MKKFLKNLNKRIKKFHRLSIKKCMHLLDLNRIDRTPNLKRLHKSYKKILKKQKKEYKSHIYSQGMFYQGWNKVGIYHGARDTDRRFDKYELSDLLLPTYSVLDIGCNVGFFPAKLHTMSIRLSVSISTRT